MSTPAKRPFGGDPQRKGSGSNNENSDNAMGMSGDRRDMVRKGSVDSDRESKKKRVSLSCAQCK